MACDQLLRHRQLTQRDNALAEILARLVLNVPALGLDFLRKIASRNSGHVVAMQGGFVDIERSWKYD